MVTIYMIIDALRGMRYKSFIPENGNHYFRLLTVLSKNMDRIEGDKLYLCNLSEYLSISNKKDAVFICMDDIRSDDSIPDETDNIILVDTEMPFLEFFTLLQDVFYNVFSWIAKMMQTTLGGGSIQDLLTLSEPVLNCTVNVTDSTMSLVAHTFGIDTDDTITGELLKNGFHSDEMLNAMKSVGCFDVWEKEDTTVFIPNIDICKYSMISHIFRLHGAYFAHAVLVCDNQPLTRGLSDLFALLVEEIGNNIRFSPFGEKAGENGYEQLLSDFTGGKVLPPNMEDDLASRVGIPRSNHYHLLIIKQEHPLSVQISRMKLELSDILPKCCVWIYQGDLLVLDTTTKGMGGLHNNTGLAEFLRRYDAYCAVSNVFTRLSALSRAYDKASVVIKHRSRILRCRYVENGEAGRILYFDGCMLPFLLAENERITDLWTDSGYARLLNRISRDDEEHGTDNIELLRTFLHFERKATQTSEALNLHRNTVLYRIEKIQELTGLDLENPRVRLDLEASFILRDMLDKPE